MGIGAFLRPSSRPAAALALAALSALPPAARAQSVPAAASDLDLLEADAPASELARPGQRGSISDELGALHPGNDVANPTGPSYSNNLSGVLNLDEKWSLDFGFLYSIVEGAPPPPGSSFVDSGGHVSLFTAGADWDSGKHWSFDLLGDLSPKSTTNSSTTLVTQLGNGGTDAITDARLDVTSSNADLQLGAGYDTHGDTRAEWMFDGSITGGHLDTAQKVTAVQDRETGRSLGAAALKAYCADHPKICGKALTAALQDRDDTLDSLKLNLGATLTAFESTDLTLSGDYFLYAQDPSEVGYFNVATSGRALTGGAGVPIAPLRLDGRVELLHRFGPFSLKLWLTAGEYAVEGDGVTYGGGLKAQYKFSRRFRVWAGASLQHDVDDTGEDLVTWGLSAGAGYRF